MADPTRSSADQSLADTAMNRADINTGTSGSMHSVDWGTEDAYWRENYSTRPYATADRNYDHYRPAYQYGFESSSRYRGRAFNDVEHDLERDWDQHRGESKSTWQDVKDAVRDAWDRVTGGHDRSGSSR